METMGTMSLAAAYFFLSRRGTWRWASLAVFVLAPVAVIVLYTSQDLLAEAVVLAAGWLLASMAGRLALACPRRADPTTRALTRAG
jgi:hypothetical protein